MADLESKNTWVFNTEDDGPKWGVFKSEAIFRLMIFLIGLAGLIAVGITVEVIVLMVNPSLLDSESELYINGLATVNTVQYLIILGVMIFLLWPRLFDLIERFKYWKHVLIGLGVGVAIIGFTILYNVIISQFIELETNSNEQAAEDMIKAFPVISIFILGFVGPICEELAYRYGLFNLLKRKSKILAYFVASLVFGIIHFDITADLITEILNFPVYLACGLFLGLAYDFCGIHYLRFIGLDFFQRCIKLVSLDISNCLLYK